MIVETTTYRISIPWFGWLLALPLRAVVRRRGSGEDRVRTGAWWLPPEILDSRQVLVLGLLAAASMSAAYVNTVFTQTVAFAAADFGIGSAGIGIAGAVVRAGIVLALPAALLADRIGRRRVITVTAWGGPAITALGALAPDFTLLVATQTIGRPLGLALAFLVAVVAAEEMPPRCRAYAVSVLALSSGLGAGLAVAVLPLADIGRAGWRLVFVASLVWMVIAVDIGRRLPETRRFERPHRRSPPLDRRRFGALAAVAVVSNLLIAPASFFQNAYLRDIRGYSAALITVFTFATATPAAIALVIGGRLADMRGRRRLVITMLPLSAVFIIAAFSIGGPPMWVSTFLGGFLASVAYPALAVYRQELFPTGNRGRVAGLLSVAGLTGGIIGLLTVGWLVEGSWFYGEAIALMAIGQLIAVVIIWRAYPETSQRSLEELNPIDDIAATASPSSAVPTPPDGRDDSGT